MFKMLAFWNIAEGSVGSPERSLTRGSVARDLAFGELTLRVRARIWMGVVAWERRAWTTDEPWVPVAPTMRKVLVAIISDEA